MSPDVPQVHNWYLLEKLRMDGQRQLKPSGKRMIDADQYGPQSTSYTLAIYAICLYMPNIRFLTCSVANS